MNEQIKAKMMSTKTKIKVKSRVAVNVVKGLVGEFAEKCNKFSSNAIEEYENQKRELERMLIENDKIIDKKMELTERNEERIHIQKGVTEKKRREAEIVNQQLEKLEAVEKDMISRNESLKREIQKMRVNQTSTQELYNDVYQIIEEMKHQKEIQQEIEQQKELQQGKGYIEDEVVDAKNNNNRSNFLPFKKKKEETEMKKHSDYRLAVRGDIFTHEDVAMNMRKTMHLLQGMYGTKPEIRAVLDKNEVALQYRYEVGHTVGGIWGDFVVDDVYYFKTSSDPSYPLITMHKEVDKDGVKEIITLAEGEYIFVSVDETEKKDQKKMDLYNNIALGALKNLAKTEMDCIDRMKEDVQENEIAMENARIVLPI